MRPLPFTDAGAGVAFYVVLVSFLALELVIRLRSLVNREGSRGGHASFVLLYVTVTTGIVSPFVLAAVVRGGPYRWMRHPSYSGLILILIGLGLALGNWAGLAIALVVPIPALVNRIRVEERALLDGLGDPYRRFAASRARLLPGVW